MSNPEFSRSFRRLVTSALVMAGALSLTGCKDPLNNGAEGSACTTQTQCGPGLVCDCATSTCQPADKGNPFCGDLDAKVPEAGAPDAAIDADVPKDAQDDADIPDATGNDATLQDATTSDASVQDNDAALATDAEVDAS